jgi:cytochrome b pre-mRNA-processing protein 3
MLLNSIFRRSKPTDAIHEIYRIVVEQARQPRFYTDFGVPDTVDGRFEMVTLHAFLVLRRLKQASESANDTAQALFDVMFEDMDLSLREMGAGDMGVGKRVKAMVQAFYGRISSYESGLAETGLAGAPDVLEEALVRNVYASVQPGEEELSGLAAYIRAQDRHLEGIERQNVETAKFSFGEV